MKVSLDMASVVRKEEIYNWRTLLKLLNFTLFHIYQRKTMQVSFHIHKYSKSLGHLQSTLIA